MANLGNVGLTSNYNVSTISPLYEVAYNFTSTFSKTEQNLNFNLFPYISMSLTNLGSITGITTINGTPSKTLVIITEAASSNIIKTVFSNASSGVFTITNIPKNVLYTITVKDINRVYADQIRSFKIAS